MDRKISEKYLQSSNESTETKSRAKQKRKRKTSQYSNEKQINAKNDR